MTYIIIRREHAEVLSTLLFISLISNGMTTVEELLKYPAYLIIGTSRKDIDVFIKEWTGFGCEPYATAESWIEAAKWVENNS